MSTLIRINVTNNRPFLHTFFFFQQPSVYTGGSEVFSNSLLSTAILPAAQGGQCLYIFTQSSVLCRGTTTPGTTYHRPALRLRFCNTVDRTHACHRNGE